MKTIGDALYRAPFDKKKILNNNTIMMAKCISKNYETEGKVRIDRLIFSDYFNTHFKHYADIDVHDPKKTAKKGDIVLIRKMPEPLTLEISYQIMQVLYKYGDMTDPISGKKCVKTMFRDDRKMLDEVYGYAFDSTPFEYEKAPDRGWQEGRKDFSHKDPYQKYHEFEKGHPMYQEKGAYWNKTQWKG